MRSLILALTWVAWDAATHKAAMDTAQDLKDELSDALDAQSAAAAATPVAKLIEFGREEEHFWQTAHLEEGVGLARKNREAAETIPKALAISDIPQAQAAFSRLQETCRACHDLHLEKRIR